MKDIFSLTEGALLNTTLFVFINDLSSVRQHKIFMFIKLVIHIDKKTEETTI